jgi:hypothetical protein
MFMGRAWLLALAFYFAIYHPHQQQVVGPFQDERTCETEREFAEAKTLVAPGFGWYVISQRCWEGPPR